MICHYCIFWNGNKCTKVKGWKQLPQYICSGFRHLDGSSKKSDENIDIKIKK